MDTTDTSLIPPVKIPTQWDDYDLRALADHPVVEDNPAAGTAILRVAYPASASEAASDGENNDSSGDLATKTGIERCLLMIKALTHPQRQKLEPFVLDRWHDDRTGCDWHVAALELDRRLRTGIGVLVQNPWDPTIGHDRQRWGAALRATKPLWPTREVCGGYNVLALPGAIPQPLTDHCAPHPLRSTPRYTVSCVTPAGYWVWAELVIPPSGNCHTLLICTDGRKFSHDVALLPYLWQVAPDAGVLFVDCVEKEMRPQWLTHLGDISTILPEVLLPRMARYVPLPPPERRIISGASFGGLSAAHLVRTRPDVIRNGIVQSASFWWNNSAKEELGAWAKGNIPTAIRVFHEYGTNEGSKMLSRNARFGEIVTNWLPGGRGRSRSYVGGHDDICWRGGIIDAMRWLNDELDASS